MSQINLSQIDLSAIKTELAPTVKKKRTRVRKLTLDILIQRNKEIHGDKFDISKTDPSKISSDGKVTVICNSCGYKWEPSYEHFMRKKRDCPKCSGNLPWCLESFLQRATEIHGDKFDYSEVLTECVNGCSSHVPLVCNTCGHRWITSVSSHIYSKSGCPNCSRKVQWTRETFVKRGRELHGEKFDYSRLTDEHFVNGGGYIPLRCNDCGYEYDCVKNAHTGKDAHGCPSCSGRVRWTKMRLIEESKEIHGDTVNYSLVEDGKLSSSTNIDLICNRCQYKWSPTVGNHIYGKTGCPMCRGTAPWTYDRFMKSAKEIHGDMYDYSLILPEDITGGESEIKIKCYGCDKVWITKVTIHAKAGCGCPICMKLQWTLSRFLERAKQKYGDSYDYSLIKDEDIKNIESEIKVICKTCQNIRITTLSTHIKSRTRCHVCNGTSLEKSVNDIISSIEGAVMSYQYSFKDSSRRYDFCIRMNMIDRPIIIESDGGQHFRFSDFFHPTYQDFEYARLVDIYKTYLVGINKYYLIRLDYIVLDNFDKTKYHITNAIELFSSSQPYENKWIYFSTPEMYTWIIDAFKSHTYPRENPRFIDD